ncbi:basal cell adhesion molecule-like [Scleropages formosus]|uniref:Basal cell adhesion molecule-like n=1 Tax=Scleropages formosus TaxID=113540 RepID=A0A0P7W958_SCLFO|nr:basal cell adhesion molecule-like [Scleropages formosus]
MTAHGSIQCNLRNGFGAENAAKLVFLFKAQNKNPELGSWAAMTVTVTPKVEVIKGESVTLPCHFAAPSLLGNSIVEWFIDEGGSRKRVAFRTLSDGHWAVDHGTQLSGRASIGQDNALVINPVHVGDDRRFHCQVTAGPSGAGEATTELKVFFPPEKPVVTASNQVLSVLGDTRSEAGQCISRNGFPMPRLIWYKNSMPLPEVKDPKEKMYMMQSQVKEASGLYTVTSTLYLQPTKEDRNAEFRCTVEYQMPKDRIDKLDSDSFSLTLHYPTEHVTFSLETTGPIKEGDEVKMKCEGDGNPQPPLDFSFINKEGEEYPKEGLEGVLTLHSATRADSGTYRCEALDVDFLQEGLFQELELFVHYLEPVKITPAGPVNVFLGEKGATTLSKTEVLTLASVSYSDTGVYSCVSTVPTVPGLHAQGNVTVTVSGKPMIATPSEAKVQKLGDAVTLSCSAQGHPAPQFSWTSSGKEVPRALRPPASPKSLRRLAVMLREISHPQPADEFLHLPFFQAVTVLENKVISKLTVEATESILKNGVACEVANEHGQDSKLFRVVLSSGLGMFALLCLTFAPPPNSLLNDALLTAGGSESGESPDTSDADRAATADRQQGGSTGVVVAVVVCVLLLLLLVTMLYCLQKKGKLPCGKEDKKEVAAGEVNNDIVVEMKSEKANEEAELLNKRPPAEQ